MKFLPLLAALGINAIPAAGFFAGRWNAEQTMLLYLCENIAMGLFVALRVRGKVSLATYALVAGGFTAVTSAFVLLFVFAFLEAPIDFEQLGTSLAGIVVFQLVQLFTTREVPPDTLLERNLGRVFLLSLSVFAGMILALFVARWFVVPFMLLKTIVDVGTLLGRAPGSAATASPPPPHTPRGTPAASSASAQDSPPRESIAEAADGRRGDAVADDVDRPPPRKRSVLRSE